MWDNRDRKTNPKAPDFKCKDKENCDGVIWPPRGKASSQSPAPRQQAGAPRQGDDRSNRIERQHSQEMAIRTCDLLITNGMISTPEELKVKLKELTDYYQRDVGRMPEDKTEPVVQSEPEGEEVF